MGQIGFLEIVNGILGMVKVRKGFSGPYRKVFVASFCSQRCSQLRIQESHQRGWGETGNELFLEKRRKEVGKE